MRFKAPSKLLVWLAVCVAAVFAVWFYRANYEVPILMYHHIGESAENSGIFVTPKAFERQMEFLKVHRYHVLSLEDLIHRLRSGESIPSKAVVITFDDGNVDNIDEALPILKKMDFPATIFMITRNIGQNGSLSEEDLRVLDTSDISIGSHTANHSFLPNLDPQAVMSELTESKQRLEEILGHPVTLFSYPAGGVTAESLALVKAAGYEGAVTTNYGMHRNDFYALHRIKISDSAGNLLGFWAKTSGLYQFGKKRIEIKAK